MSDICGFQVERDGFAGFMQKLGYPLVMGAALLTFTLVREFWDGSSLYGFLVPIAVAVAVGAVGVTVLERVVPYRSDWKPDWKTVARDGNIFFWVQVIQTKAMALVAGFVVLGVWAIEIGVNETARAQSPWPHDWPLAAQAALMMICAEFVRYWLHRGFHQVGALWRLHRFHHVPAALYWVNAGRLHPFEKVFQYFADTVPFLVFLHVGSDVLAIYTVFYAVNGFFQHVNADLRMGWLNYLVSGPELHRWHHSTDKAEADHNFGNNLIVWDLVFGTWFLPKERDVTNVGVRQTGEAS